MPERVVAFAPGRVNLIGEHTDYNGGLALPFAIEQGVTVHGQASSGDPQTGSDDRIHVHASAFDEHDELPLADPPRTSGWRAFVRGVVAELARAGYAPSGARLRIDSDLAIGAGLSSSAALAVALSLALLALSDVEVVEDPPAEGDRPAPIEPPASIGWPAPIGRSVHIEQPTTIARLALAQLCAHVEREWADAQTGLLDQLASLYGEEHMALRIDFATLQIERVPLRLRDGWRLVTLDSGERHANAVSGYNARRRECAQACTRLHVRTLSEADMRAVATLPETLGRRVRHVLTENERVREAAAALRSGNLPAVGALLDASHASLREDYEVSTPAVEAAAARLRAAGAAGARLIGGGFGGHVLGLLPPGARAPAGAHEVRAGAGAWIQAQ